MADELGARITEQVQNLRLARELFPSWVETGFKDYSCTVHSYGISFWTALGQAMGYEAICELPAPSNGRYSAVGDDVRSDSAWFDRQSSEPILLVEFERYDGLADKDKLMGKVSNLLLAHHRWGQRARVVLAYWTKGLCDCPDHAMLANRFKCGYHTSAMERVEGSGIGTLLIYQFILRECEIGRWRLWQIRERGTY
jgi:hypothetical protein